MVTCRNWAEIWLNEGFATYFDALFTEHFYGVAAFRDQMDDNRRSYFNGEGGGEGRFPIYDPDYMWGVTVYEKGAWILHMLRQVLGTATWQEGVRVYGARHRFGTATTPDLIAAFEDVSGVELNWFFDQWVYQAGYPEFRYTHGGYPEAGGEGRFPIYDPDHMWGVTVYEKGAWILHMLRQLLGTSTWQEGVRVYGARHRYGTVTTPDLIAAFEDVSGTELDWFFDQWVYQAGYPEFRYTFGGYPAAGGYTMTIALRQVQQNAPLFRMPLDVGVTTTAGTQVHRVEVSGEYSSFELDLDGPPSQVVIDPEVWALAGWTWVDLTGDVDGSGRVDGLDNSRMAWAFGSGMGGGRWFAPADLNEDGVVDGQDLALLASNFGNSL